VPQSDSSIKFVLYNFTSTAGIYPSDRIRIGIFQQRELFLDLLVHHHSGKDIKTGIETVPRKVIHYTVSIGNPSSRT
jgi:hypothetical protein